MVIRLDEFNQCYFKIFSGNFGKIDEELRCPRNLDDNLLIAPFIHTHTHTHTHTHIYIYIYIYIYI